MEIESVENNAIKRALLSHLRTVTAEIPHVLVGMEIVPGSITSHTEELAGFENMTSENSFLQSMKQLREILPQIGNQHNSLEKENQTLKLYVVIKRALAECKSGALRNQACKDSSLKLLINCLEAEIKMLHQLVNSQNKVLWAGIDDATEAIIRKKRNLSQYKIEALTEILNLFLGAADFNPQGNVMCDICLIMTQDVPLESFESVDHDCLDNFNCLGKIFIKMMIALKELKLLKTRNEVMNLKPLPPKYSISDTYTDKTKFKFDENGFRIDDNIYTITEKSKKVQPQVANITQSLSGESQNAAYRALLKSRIFSYAKFDYDEKLCGSSTICSGDVVKRIMKEIADLKNQLPAEASHSIYVVAHSERIDVMKAIIIGAEGTPYAHGAFEFIIYCGKGFPEQPPKVLLLTTGFGTVRFNPNLYACGKVCLSILGTWSGRNASENWNPQTSTLSQVLLSIQALVMGDSVYFNEPGYERQEGTPEGEKRNIAYSNVVRINNINYGMLNQILNPPEGFEDIIKLHFALKKDAITKTIEEWEQLAQTQKHAVYDGLVLSHNPWAKAISAPGAYLRELRDLKTHAISEMKSIKPPTY
jgi:ubiquitin-protein ligase